MRNIPRFIIIMPHYFALIEKEKDFAFGITFPDVPNCFSASDERKDVMAHVVEALSFLAEDEALPASRNLAQLGNVPATDYREGERVMCEWLNLRPKINSWQHSATPSETPPSNRQLQHDQVATCCRNFPTRPQQSKVPTHCPAPFHQAAHRVTTRAFAGCR